LRLLVQFQPNLIGIAAIEKRFVRWPKGKSTEQQKADNAHPHLLQTALFARLYRRYINKSLPVLPAGMGELLGCVVWATLVWFLPWKKSFDYTIRASTA
jgi:hypothetical protein